MGVAKVANNWNDLVKGSLTRQKLQNSKVYAKSPEFSPVLGLIITPHAQRERGKVIGRGVHIYISVVEKKI